MSSAARAATADGELGAQLGVVEQLGRARPRTRRRRRAGRAARRRRRPPRPTTPTPPRAARRARSLRARAVRSPRSATRCRTRRRGGSARRLPATAVSPSTAHERPVDACPPRPQPGGPTTTSSRSGVPRARRARPHSTIVGRSLRGSTVPTVSTYGGVTPARRDHRVDLVVGADSGRIDAERARRRSTAASKPSRTSSSRVNVDGAMTSVGMPPGQLEPAAVEAHAARGGDVRDAEERDVVHRDDERRIAHRRHGEARSRARRRRRCDTAAVATGASTRSAGCRAARPRSIHAVRSGMPVGRAPAREREHVDARGRQDAQQRLHVPADAARDRLQQLTRVYGNPHAAPTLLVRLRPFGPPSPAARFGELRASGICACVGPRPSDITRRVPRAAGNTRQAIARSRSTRRRPSGRGRGRSARSGSCRR